MIDVLRKVQTIMETKSDSQHNFYTRSKLHLFIVNYLFLSMKDDKTINFVKIFENVPKRIGARSTIFEVLQEGLDLKYFQKIHSDPDKRKRIYSLTPDYYDFISELWEIENAKKILPN